MPKMNKLAVLLSLSLLSQTATCAIVSIVTDWGTWGPVTVTRTEPNPGITVATGTNPLPQTVTGKSGKWYGSSGNQHNGAQYHSGRSVPGDIHPREEEGAPKGRANKGGMFGWWHGGSGAGNKQGAPGMSGHMTSSCTTGTGEMPTGAGYPPNGAYTGGVSKGFAKAPNQVTNMPTAITGSPNAGTGAFTFAKTSPSPEPVASVGVISNVDPSPEADAGSLDQASGTTFYTSTVKMVKTETATGSPSVL